MSDYAMRKFRPGDEPGLSRLSKVVLKENVPDGYWTWKYTDNPWGDSYSYVAEAGGEIVGFVGGMAWQLRVQGKDYPGAQVTDLMLDPAWRRKGIFFPLNAKSQEEIFMRASWHYGVTNPTSFKIFQNRYGYQGFRPHKIQKVLDIRPFLREYLRGGKGFKTPSLKKFLPRLMPGRRKAASAPEFALEEVDVFDERFDDLWSRVHSSMIMATTKTSRHLNWRYRANPRHKYSVLAARKGTQIAGFAVLRFEESDGIRRGFIVDFLTDPASRAAGLFLVGGALGFFKRRKAAVVNTWMFEHDPEYAAFAAHGFVPKTAETVMILTNSLTDDFSKDFMADVGNWHFVMGDCEVF